MQVFDCIIVGSGGAGATAGLYCSRSCLTNLLLTGPQKGGLLTTTHMVENYPGVFPGVTGITLTDTMIEQAQHYGTIIKDEICTKVYKEKDYFITVTQNEKYKSKSVIWATGSTPKKLQIPGEEFYNNKGISYCAVCDGFFFKDLEVAVVGGGSSALEEALYLSKIVKKVYLIHRRNTFRGEVILHDEVTKTPNIEMILESIVIEALGTERDLEKLKVKNLKSQEEYLLLVQGFFIAIGHQPNTEIIKDLIKVAEDGYVEANNTKTELPGFFVAGDVQDRVYRQAVTAAASGCIAALECLKFIRENSFKH